MVFPKKPKVDRDLIYTDSELRMIADQEALLEEQKELVKKYTEMYGETTLWKRIKAKFVARFLEDHSDTIIKEDFEVEEGFEPTKDERILFPDDVPLTLWQRTWAKILGKKVVPIPNLIRQEIELLSTPGYVDAFEEAELEEHMLIEKPDKWVLKCDLNPVTTFFPATEIFEKARDEIKEEVKLQELEERIALGIEEGKTRIEIIEEEKKKAQKEIEYIDMGDGQPPIKNDYKDFYGLENYTPPLNPFDPLHKFHKYAPKRRARNIRRGKMNDVRANEILQTLRKYDPEIDELLRREEADERDAKFEKKEEKKEKKKEEPKPATPID